MNSKAVRKFEAITIVYAVQPRSSLIGEAGMPNLKYMVFNGKNVAYATTQ